MTNREVAEMLAPLCRDAGVKNHEIGEVLVASSRDTG
jgi:hypothetical protein